MITEEILKERLDYDPETGLFVWKPNSKNDNAWAARYVGKVAGSKTTKGYLQLNIKINNKAYTYLQHALAWLYMFGELPKLDLDHINGIPTDNRICNLRLATQSENSQNIFKPKITNKLNTLGVYPVGKKFFSTIMINGVSTRLGTFSTIEEAHIAYLNAKRVLHPFSQI